jgi:hypothetical protein
MFLLVMAFFFQAAAAAQGVVLRTFEDDKIGAPPAGFHLAAGREAPPAQWTVRREGKAQVLVHEGKTAPADSFAVAILSGAQYSDVSVSVKLKATGTGRSAGLVWRYQDPMNHYSVHLDLVRQELSMYRVVSGNRIRIEREDDLELDADAWHSLRILNDKYSHGFCGLFRLGPSIVSSSTRKSSNITVESPATQMPTLAGVCGNRSRSPSTRMPPR